METPTQYTQTFRMNERTKQIIRDQAFDLAYQAFADPDDEHILCVYSRLIWNYQRGLADDGAVTVH